MPLQNRVDPFGQIHAVTARGMFMGNRGGCFHRDDQTLKPTHWASRQWITCLLDFKGRKRTLMQPGRYTELFFLDEVTSLAAGHRPCYECRRSDAIAFRDALLARGVYTKNPGAGELDDAIAGEIQVRFKGYASAPTCQPADLPDGAILSLNGAPYLKWDGLARLWAFEGYGAGMPLPVQAVCLTPKVTLEALRGGYRPHVHPSISQPGESRSTH